MSWSQILLPSELTVKDYLGLLLSLEHLHYSVEMEVWMMCLHMSAWTTEPLATALDRSDAAENHICPHLPKLPHFNITLDTVQDRRVSVA